MSRELLGPVLVVGVLAAGLFLVDWIGRRRQRRRFAAMTAEVQHRREINEQQQAKARRTTELHTERTT